jgi:LysM repeat protein
LTLSLAPLPRRQPDAAGSPTPPPGLAWSGPDPITGASPAGGPVPGSGARPRRAAVRRHVPVSIRRRRIVGSCAATTVAFALAAVISGSVLLWTLAALAAGLAVSYAGLVTWVVRRAGRQDLRDAFGSAATIDWGQLESDLRLSEDDDLPTVVAPAPSSLTVVDLARFATCYLAAWALTPVVMVLRLAGGDLRDLERHDVLGRLVRFQQYGRSRSWQVLTASVAATATVAVVGSTASVAFAAPAVAAGTTSYTVRSGDTLSSIATSYGTTVAALAAANGLANPDLIYAGQVLSLGAGASAPAVASTSGASGSYTVAAGDTLGSIAAAHGTTVAALASANALADPNLIFVGQVLTLGGGSSTPAPAAAAPTASSGTTYTVQSGDTLAGIAAREGTTWPALAAINDLSNPNVIFVGEVLTLSGTGTPTTTAVATQTPAAAPAAAAPAPTASSAAAEAVSVALAQVGTPYVYGGASPGGFDCSGLVMYAWAAAGVSLPHYSVSQYSDTTRISEAELQPGDIVFYDNDSGPQPGHEALYIGNGQVVAANTTGTNVQTQSITWDGTPMGFGRVA